MKLLLCAAFLLLPCGAYAQTAPAPGGTPGSPTILGATNSIAEATSSLGAYVSFSVTASDTDSSPLTPLCNPASGSLFALGSTTVTCIAESVAAPGASTTASFYVSIVDTTAPVFNILPVDQAFATTSAPAHLSLTYPTTSDAVDNAPTISYTPSEFSFGTTTVVWMATDASGNQASTTSLVVLTEYTPPAETTAPVVVPLGNGPPVGFLPAPVNAPAPTVAAPSIQEPAAEQTTIVPDQSNTTLVPQAETPALQITATTEPKPHAHQSLLPTPQAKPVAPQQEPRDALSGAQLAAVAQVAPTKSIDYIGLLILLLLVLLAAYSEWRREKRASRSAL